MVHPRWLRLGGRTHAGTHAAGPDHGGRRGLVAKCVVRSCRSVVRRVPRVFPIQHAVLTPARLAANTALELTASTWGNVAVFHA